MRLLQLPQVNVLVNVCCSETARVSVCPWRLLLGNDNCVIVVLKRETTSRTIRVAFPSSFVSSFVLCESEIRSGTRQTRATAGRGTQGSLRRAAPPPAPGLSKSRPGAPTAGCRRRGSAGARSVVPCPALSAVLGSGGPASICGILLEREGLNVTSRDPERPAVPPASPRVARCCSAELAPTFALRDVTNTQSVIHASKDGIDDQSGTTQPDSLTATLESDGPTTPEEPPSTFPERKFGDPSLSLPARSEGSPHSLRARSTVSRSHVTGHRQVPGECSQSSV